MYSLNSERHTRLLEATDHLMTLGQQLLSRQTSNDALIHSLQEILNIVTQLQQYWYAVQEQEKNWISTYNHLHRLKEKLTSLLPTLTPITGSNIAIEVIENEDRPKIHLVYPIISRIEEMVTLLDQVFSLIPQVVMKKEKTVPTVFRSVIDPSIEHIAQMVTAASLTEPEWMERTGEVLIVDANHNTSSSLHRRLVKDGHQVHVVEDPARVLIELSIHQIDVLIIDIATVGISTSFFHDLRQHQSTGYIPIIAMGPLTDAEAITWSIEAGADDYLPKPPNPTLLKARVRSAIEKKVAYENRLQRLNELHQTRQDLESAITRLADGFALFDAQNRLFMYNDKLLLFYPHLNDYPQKHPEQKSLKGVTFEELLKANLAAGVYMVEDAFSSGVDEKRQSWIVDKLSRFLSPSGQWEETLVSGFTLQATSYRTPDGGGVLMLKDISEKKADQQRLAFMAYHDPLTGLANRELFHQKLKIALEKKSENKAILSLLFLDLDGFKDINDTYGHEVGDWLLTQVAQRLRHWVRENDMVARLGGDEFSIILDGPGDQETVTKIAQRILASLSAPYQKDKDTLRIGVSIGIAIDQEDNNKTEILINQADMAMYAAKQAGKGKLFFFQDLAMELPSSTFHKAVSFLKNGLKREKSSIT